MSELGETYKALKEHSQEKRASNREQSAQYLTNAGIPFTSNNHGAHLIVEGKDCFIDFWPGTGKWISRNKETGFGVRNLVNFITG
jgi:hypothetical protein